MDTLVEAVDLGEPRASVFLDSFGLRHHHPAAHRGPGPPDRHRIFFLLLALDTC